MALSAFLCVACVDKSFRLDEVSTEVTLGSGTTTIPLGYLEEQTIGDLLGEETMEGIVVDPETGDYSIAFSGDEASFEVEGIASSFEIPELVNRFRVEYPDIELSSEPIIINQESAVKLDMGVIKDFKFGDEYILPEGISVPPIKGELYDVIRPEDIHFAVPEQIDAIENLYFKDVDTGHHGAPIHMSLALNDFKDINGGGELAIDVKLAGGEFKIIDGDGNVFRDNRYTKTYDLSSADASLDFVLYVESIHVTEQLDSNHELDIPLELSYDMTFDMHTKPGTFSLEHLPSFHVDADFEYGDADVLLNSDTALFEYHASEGGNEVVLGNLPDEIKSIKRIALEKDTHIRLFAHGLDWMSENTRKIEADITLPDYLVLHKIQDVDYEYNEEGHLLKATLADLDRGLEIEIEAIEFDGEGLTPENGELRLNFTPDIEVRFMPDAHLLVSELIPSRGEEVILSTGVESAALDVLSLCGQVDYSYEQREVIELGDTSMMSNGLEINGTGLSPVINISLTNPLTIEAAISAELVPMNNGVAHTENRVVIDNLVITPATYLNGAIKESRMNIVLAKEERRDEFASSESTFVACDVDKLLSGSIPDALQFNIALNTDAEKQSELYVADSFVLSYDYGIDVPLAFNRDLSISYSDTVGELSSTFEQLAGYSLKVGDATLIVNSSSTIPLDFILEAELLDAFGKPTPAQLRTPEGGAVIKGSEDGRTAANSQTRLAIVLPEGDMESIGEVDAIRFDFSAKGASLESLSLNEQQSLSVKLQLEVAGGITIDLGSMMDGEDDGYDEYYE